MKKTVALLLVCALLIPCFSTTAFAYDYITSVEYTTSPTYVINIPATITLNENFYIDITADQMLMEEGKQLVLYVDPDCLTESTLYMYMDGNDAAGHVSAFVTNSQKAPFAGIEEDGFIAAVFQGNNRTPTKFGTLSFITNWDNAFALGTYTATLNFTCQIEDIPS